MNNILTIPIQECRIAFLITILVVGTSSMSCSTWINSDWGDCGYQASYTTNDSDGKPEIVFSEITAETVGGHRNCGFKYIQTKVDRAEIDGIELPERAVPDKYVGNHYFYAVPNGFDPRKTAITIYTRGGRYRSDPSSVKQTDARVNVKLKPVWFW